MNRYAFTCTLTTTIEVEAETLEEAEIAAESEFFDDCGCSPDTINLLREEKDVKPLWAKPEAIPT